MYQITQGDLNSAARGLNLLGKTKEELQELISRHGGENAAFASQVIAASARQILAAKKQVGLI